MKWSQHTHCISVVLEINFGKFNYRVEEDSEGLNYPIILQFRENQNPFNITLTPVTVNTAEAMGLGFFINSGTIVQGSRTTAGSYGYYNIDALRYKLYDASPSLLSCS